jgi:hypothetical protein
VAGQGPQLGPGLRVKLVRGDVLGKLQPGRATVPAPAAVAAVLTGRAAPGPAVRWAAPLRAAWGPAFPAPVRATPLPGTAPGSAALPIAARSTTALPAVTLPAAARPTATLPSAAGTPALVTLVRIAVGPCRTGGTPARRLAPTVSVTAIAFASRSAASPAPVRATTLPGTALGSAAPPTTALPTAARPTAALPATPLPTAALPSTTGTPAFVPPVSIAVRPRRVPGTATGGLAPASRPAALSRSAGASAFPAPVGLVAITRGPGAPAGGRTAPFPDVSLVTGLPRGPRTAPARGPWTASSGRAATAGRAAAAPGPAGVAPSPADVALSPALRPPVASLRAASPASLRVTRLPCGP